MKPINKIILTGLLIYAMPTYITTGLMVYGLYQTVKTTPNDLRRNIYDIVDGINNIILEKSIE